MWWNWVVPQSCITSDVQTSTYRVGAYTVMRKCRMQHSSVYWIFIESSGPTPLQWAGAPTAPSGAQSLIQPDHGHLQRWGTHHLPGQPVSVPHRLYCNRLFIQNVFLTSGFLRIFSKHQWYMMSPVCWPNLPFPSTVKSSSDFVRARINLCKRFEGLTQFCPEIARKRFVSGYIWIMLPQCFICIS